MFVATVIKLLTREVVKIRFLMSITFGITFFTFWLKECGHVNEFVVCRGFLHSLVFLLHSKDSTLFYFSFFGRLCGRSGDGRHYIHVCGRTLSLL